MIVNINYKLLMNIENYDLKTKKILSTKIIFLYKIKFGTIHYK